MVANYNTIDGKQCHQALEKVFFLAIVYPGQRQDEAPSFRQERKLIP
jgi:hypothetical protein